MEPISAFERRVIQLALRGDEPWILGLRQQVPHLMVVRRAVFPVGFNTYIRCEPAISPVVIPRTEAGLPVNSYPPTVNAIRDLPVPGLASFIVWVGRDGTIVELEAVSMLDDKWPENREDGFHSFQDDKRNLIDEKKILESYKIAS
jgi:hypothetical protein